MAELSDMIFKNTLGQITLTRIMYSINHSYTWTGGSGRANIEISVSGTIKGSEADLSAIIGKMARRGDRGTLTLPNKVYSNMRINGMSFQGVAWTNDDWGKVSLSFSDDSESGENPNTITLQTPDAAETITVYEPKIVFKPASNSYSEKMSHLFDGYFRQSLGYDFLKISLSGVVLIDGNNISESLFKILEQKQEINKLPNVGRLSTFIPEVKSNIDPNFAMISDASIQWRVEKRSATIAVSFIAPPQEITKIEVTP